MKVVLFTLCEGVFNTDGRLTIVNTFEDILSNEYPWKGQLGVALKLLVPKNEPGEYDIQVCIKKAIGDQTLHQLNAHLSFPQEKEQHDVHIAMASNIQGLLLPAPGNYKVDIVINGEVQFSSPFKALKQND